jgi:phosphoribosylcarboxyaminoimidazole (NCAIR) mutase
MGSDPDMPKLTTKLQLLEDFVIPYHVYMISQYFTAKWMMKPIKTALSKGIIGMISAAGDVANFPGKAGD